MKVRPFIFGLVFGAALASGLFWIFGDAIRGNLANTTEQLGRGVEKAGESIKQSGRKLDD